MISSPGGNKIFQFPPFALLKGVTHTGRVSPFGHLRVKAYLAAHRSFSQPQHVLHRLLMPRHPPCTLASLQFHIFEQVCAREFSVNYYFFLDNLLLLLVFKFLTAQSLRSKEQKKLAIDRSAKHIRCSRDSYFCLLIVHT